MGARNNWMGWCAAVAIAVGAMCAGAQTSGPYRMAGTVTNAATGEPVGRALVAILAESDSHAVATVVSDGEGHFAFAKLAAGKYQLTASKRGFRTSLYDEHEGFNTAIVTGPEQDPTHLDFRLTAGAVLHGVVTGDGGDPVDGARVMLFRRPRPRRAGERSAHTDTAMTDDTGAYEFANLPAGDYLLAVTATPWYALHKAAGRAQNEADDQGAALDVAYPVTYFDSTTEEASATAITLGPGGREEANINLHAVPALHLSIEAPRSAEGRQMYRSLLQQNVFGEAVSTDGGESVSRLKPGSVEFSGLAPGHYELTAGDPPRIVDLDATASQQVDLANAIPTAAVSGTLRMAGGMALPEDAQVFLQAIDGPRGQASKQTQAHHGHFNFDEVAPGDWTVLVEAGGKMQTVVSVGSKAGNLLTVRDRALNVPVSLGQGTTRIEGFARKDGKGFAGAMIVLVPRNLAALQALARRDQSDSDGSFALPEVVPGQYTIVAIEDAWELDWSQPEVIARYLQRGTAVTVTESSGALVRLMGPVTVEPR